MNIRRSYASVRRTSQPVRATIVVEDEATGPYNWLVQITWPFNWNCDAVPNASTCTVKVTSCRGALTRVTTYREVLSPSYGEHLIPSDTDRT